MNFLWGINFDFTFSFSSAHTELNLTRGSEARLSNDLTDIRNETSNLRSQMTTLMETLSSKRKYLRNF
jgi:hypothetical protein